MIDRTFDIAQEYIRRINLSYGEILELNAIHRRDEAERAAFNASESTGPQIMSHEEHMRERAKDPKLVRRLMKMSARYCRDRRLCYSNDYYYQVVFSVALNDLIETTLSDGISAYGLASQIISEHRSLSDGNNFEKWGNTVHQQAAVGEFKRRVRDMGGDFTWHRDRDGGLDDIFAVAFHRGQEIDDEQIQIRMSRMESFLRGRRFAYFLYIPYCIIPYLVQEIVVGVMAGINLAVHGVPAHETLADFRRAVDRNYLPFISAMLFTATVVWMWIFS